MKASGGCDTPCTTCDWCNSTSASYEARRSSMRVNALIPTVRILMGRLVSGNPLIGDLMAYMSLTLALSL